MLRYLILFVLFSLALWLATGLIRSTTIPGVASLEKQIHKDWEQLSKDTPELGQVQEISVEGSAEGGLSKLWATEAKLNCLAVSNGPLGAEILLIPISMEDGSLGATVQVYLYDLKSGQFVKEISRLYRL